MKFKNIGQKILIFFAGFPGVGKSYLSKRLYDKMPDPSFFIFKDNEFTTELFRSGKEKRNPDFFKPPFDHEAFETIRCNWFTKYYLPALENLFNDFEVITIDINFDRIGIRKLFLNWCNKNRIKPIIIEIRVPEKEIKQRMTRDSTHPSAAERPTALERMKEGWQEIMEKHYVVNNSQYSLADPVEKLIDILKKEKLIWH